MDDGFFSLVATARIGPSSGAEPVIPIEASTETRPAAQPPAQVRTSPSQAAMALTAYVLGDEEGEERVQFLTCVEEAARDFGVRGFAHSGSASIVTLVGSILSGFDQQAKQMTSHRAACRDWVQSLP